MDEATWRREIWAKRRHPENVGELVRCDDSPGYDKGLQGWKSGPKLEEHHHNDGFTITKDDVGLVIAVWSAEPGQAAYCATRWFCVMVPNKGISWFPLGWILTADSPAYQKPPFVSSYGCGD